ncbi:exonuclease SbcCD subunit D C-terminal domain-containing protein [Otariodibacter sp.]|uniref:exonuclease SbcCD subunit D C-terminal domain-containing protein n=1 Tax=Otariodibacter sp. TaxID=3030919 RepID=UPI002628D580|nr:exonuclease SbcCD subunit D C-terminal domain-containing protein [Otariodibacter sp.]
MKIIHTSDWHIGKRLHNYDLSQDFNLFSTWLLDVVKEKGVNLLLVSGDIFDLANPSSSARQQYYSFLIRLKEIGCKVILTGGNHDSASVLNAPKEILNAIDIKVVGSLPNDFDEYIIPVYDDNGKAVVIHAIPFLRDADLRNANDGTQNDRIRIVQEGIQKVFEKSLKFGKEKYPDYPHIAMGHLFTAGVSTSDSEREIQIGNEAKFDAHRLGKGFDYVALGHIHKPQKVNADIPIYYSGSPISLSFSERTDNKRILLLDTEKGFEPESITIPLFRKLQRISGNLEKIQSEINRLKVETSLTTLLEIELIEECYNANLEDRFMQLLNDFSHSNAEIVKTKLTFKDRVIGAHELYGVSEDITELKPIEMFSKLLETQAYPDEDEQALKIAFNELVEQVQHAEEV